MQYLQTQIVQMLITLDPPVLFFIYIWPDKTNKMQLFWRMVGTVFLGLLWFSNIFECKAYQFNLNPLCKAHKFDKVSNASNEKCNEL